MKPSKIVFIILFINLLALYLSTTTKVVLVNESIDFILTLLNIPIIIYLFLIRDTIWEFLKYLLILVLFTITYNYISPYITYRSEAFEKIESLNQRYKKESISNINNERTLKEKLKKWKNEMAKYEKFNTYEIRAFEVALFLIDKKNGLQNLNDINKLKEEHSLGKKIIYRARTIGLRSSLEKALGYILELSKEERSIYDVETICYLANQDNGLMKKINKTNYEHENIRRFLLDSCVKKEKNEPTIK